MADVVGDDDVVGESDDDDGDNRLAGLLPLSLVLRYEDANESLEREEFLVKISGNKKYNLTKKG